MHHAKTASVTLKPLWLSAVFRSTRLNLNHLGQAGAGQILADPERLGETIFSPGAILQSVGPGQASGRNLLHENQFGASGLV